MCQNTILVNAENGSEKIYTIRVNREEKEVGVEKDEVNEVLDENKNIEKSDNTKYVIAICLIFCAVIIILMFLIKNKRK